MTFKNDDRFVFELSYDQIALASAQSKNEVAIELNTEVADQNQ